MFGKFARGFVATAKAAGSVRVRWTEFEQYLLCANRRRHGRSSRCSCDDDWNFEDVRTSPSDWYVAIWWYRGFGVGEVRWLW